jgi:hypothetical protein
MSQVNILKKLKLEDYMILLMYVNAWGWLIKLKVAKIVAGNLYING